MIHAQNAKWGIITSPAAIVNNASLTTASIDTAGWEYIEVVVVLGATDIALTALKIQESDSDGSYADITGMVYGTSAGINGSTSSLPSATDDNKLFAFQLDLRGRKRWLDVVDTVGNGSTGAYQAIIYRLSRGSDFPVTAAECGFANILRLP